MSQTIYHFYFENSSKFLTYIGDLNLNLHTYVVDHTNVKDYEKVDIVFPYKYYNTMKYLTGDSRANYDYEILKELNAIDEIADIFEDKKQEVLDTYIKLFKDKIHGNRFKCLNKRDLSIVIASFISNFVKLGAIDYEGKYNVYEQDLVNYIDQLKITTFDNEIIGSMQNDEILKLVYESTQLDEMMNKSDYVWFMVFMVFVICGIMQYM